MYLKNILEILSSNILNTFTNHLFFKLNSYLFNLFIYSYGKFVIEKNYKNRKV